MAWWKRAASIRARHAPAGGGQQPQLDAVGGSVALVGGDRLLEQVAHVGPFHHQIQVARAHLLQVEDVVDQQDEALAVRRGDGHQLARLRRQRSGDAAQQ